MRSRTHDRCSGCGLHTVCAQDDGSGCDPGQPRLALTRGEIEVGRPLYHAGQRVDALYALRSGCVKEVLTRADGTESVVRVSVAGEIVSLASLSGMPSRTTAVAVTTTRYCRIPLASVASATRDVPAIGSELMRLLATKMNAAHELVASVLDRDAVSRVAAFVLDLSNRLELAGFDGRRFQVGFSRSDIASYLGMTIETVSRAFSELRRRRILDVRAKDLALLSIGDLRVVAENTTG
jgi:CRP/FNR family transcriptional regulator